MWVYFLACFSPVFFLLIDLFHILVRVLSSYSNTTKGRLDDWYSLCMCVHICFFLRTKMSSHVKFPKHNKLNVEAKKKSTEFL